MRSVRSTLTTLVIALALIGASRAIDAVPHVETIAPDSPPGLEIGPQLTSADAQPGDVAACEPSPAAASRAITISDIVFNSPARRSVRFVPANTRVMRNSDFVLKKTVSDRSTAQQMFS